MTKPFTIISTEEVENDLIKVDYIVEKNTLVMEGSQPKETIVSLQSAMCVPKGEDIDTYIYNALLEAGWILQ